MVKKMKWRRLKYFTMAFLLIEVSSFIVIGHLLGLLLTLLAVAATTMLGGYLFRQQGREMALKMQKAMQAQAASGLFQNEVHLVPVAAILLIIPGFFSDLVGLVILLPPVRRYLEHRLMKKTRTKAQEASVIEGECRPVDAQPINDRYDKKDP